MDRLPQIVILAILSVMSVACREGSGPASSADDHGPVLTVSATDVLNSLETAYSRPVFFEGSAEIVSGRRFRRWQSRDATMLIAETRGQAAAIRLEFQFSSLGGLLSMRTVLKTAIPGFPVVTAERNEDLTKVLDVLAAKLDGPARAVVGGNEITAQTVLSGGQGRRILMTISAVKPVDASPVSPAVAEPQGAIVQESE